jgi:hypothetical protein
LVEVMTVTLIFAGIIAALFLGMVGFQTLGHHLGLSRRQKNPEDHDEGTTAVEAALFALLGLLVAFTFSGAETRLNERRVLIVDEANAIGTAYLRLDLLPQSAQPVLREEMRRYVDSRIAYYHGLLNFHAARAERRRSGEIQQQIWNDALVAAGETNDTRATLLLVPALNEMIDLTTRRDAALRTHEPLPIFVLLVALAFACAFFAGLGMAKTRRPSRLHIVAFAAVMALTAYVILNLEFPRAGLIRLGPIDAILREVRASMG